MRQLITALALLLLPATAPAAQSPTRLVQASDLEYLGSVTIPAMRETDPQGPAGPPRDRAGDGGVA